MALKTQRGARATVRHHTRTENDTRLAVWAPQNPIGWQPPHNEFFGRRTNPPGGSPLLPPPIYSSDRITVIFTHGRRREREYPALREPTPASHE